MGGEKKIVERGKSQMTIWRMRIACWIPKATNTHNQNLMFIGPCIIVLVEE